MKVYEYKGCSTCRNALRFLDSKKILYSKIPIRETPPSISELKKALKFLGGDSKKLFNTSGQDYKALNLKEKLLSMTEEDKLTLLSQNGNLVKRPFVISSEFVLVGFKEEDWKKVIK
ncbi:MAG: Spx/MgsR family RNA polymerase-binding regulatory protein [Leptospiraceae bacterium]|nr:Spx/MgsR family RNA polymerase-binding regulatory protein [Leptospiraceae bacterium]